MHRTSTFLSSYGSGSKSLKAGQGSAHALGLSSVLGYVQGTAQRPVQKSVYKSRAWGCQATFLKSRCMYFFIHSLSIIPHFMCNSEFLYSQYRIPFIASSFIWYPFYRSMMIYIACFLFLNLMKMSVYSGVCKGASPSVHKC